MWSALTMVDGVLKLLSSQSSPEGMSMLTTSAGDELMSFTSEAKPPLSGFFSPMPKRASMTSVSSSSFGVSNCCVI